MKLILFIKQHGWILLIIGLAAALRFYQLGQIPQGLTWDEAAIGYNGFAVVHTRRDEWLQRLPVSFRSFGDYKAPLAIYVNGVFTWLLDLNPLAVRLPFALSGVVAVIGFFLLTKEWLQAETNLKQSRINSLSLVASLLLALSPWHLHFTRAGFESGLALTFLIWGWWSWLRFLRLTTSRSLNSSKHSPLILTGWLLLSVVLCTATLYTYHSSKIFVPTLFLISIIRHRSQLWNQKLAGLISATLGLVLSYPLMKDSLFGSGLQRANTLIISQLKGWELVTTFFKNLAQHSSPAFLILGKTDTLRHSPGNWGVLLPTTFFLGLIAVGVVLAKTVFCKVKTDHSFSRLKSELNWLQGALGWILLGIIPAALGQTVPQANRALFALPGFIWLALLGWHILSLWIKISFNSCWLAKGARISVALVSLHLIFFGCYFRYYYQAFAQQSADAYNAGYLEAMNYVIDYEQGSNGRPEKSKIVFTSDYGQPYIYALFARKTNPIWYQGGSLVKYEFKDDIDIGDLQRTDAVIVASAEDELPVERANKLIHDKFGQLMFKIYLTD